MLNELRDQGQIDFDSACAVNQQSAQVGVATFADAQESTLTTRAVLPRRQPQRGSKLSAVGKLVGIAEGDHQRSGDHRADTAQLLQTNGGGLIDFDHRDLVVEFADPAMRRADRIGKKLQWKPGIFNGDGVKPKGMHWKTYNRLKAEHTGYVVASLMAMEDCYERYERELARIE